MKTLLISSSPHKEKSQTFLLAKEVLKECTNSVESEIIHLFNYRIEFCRHCEKCHKKILQCLIKDDVHLILEKMLNAEGIIFASPNYINQITASMKALFDRSSHFIHRKRLLGKYIIGVVSSRSGHLYSTVSIPKQKLFPSQSGKWVQSRSLSRSPGFPFSFKYLSR